VKMVLANGCFDVLHPGHLHHLQEARKMGDLLYVALTLDACVFKGPGRPIHKWDDRADMLRALRIVHGVYPTNNAVNAIRRIKPDIFVKGIDYAGGDRFTEDIAAACKEVGAELRYTSSPKRSVTELIRRVNGT